MKKVMMLAIFLFSVCSSAQFLSNEMVFNFLNGSYVGESTLGSGNLPLEESCGISFERISEDEKKAVMTFGDKRLERTFNKSSDLFENAGAHGLTFKIDFFNLYGVIQGEAGQLTHLDRVISSRISNSGSINCINLEKL